MKRWDAKLKGLMSIHCQPAAHGGVNTVLLFPIFTVPFSKEEGIFSLQSNFIPYTDRIGTICNFTNNCAKWIFLCKKI